METVKKSQGDLYTICLFFLKTNSFSNVMFILIECLQRFLTGLDAKDIGCYQKCILHNTPVDSN